MSTLYCQEDFDTSGVCFAHGSPFISANSTSILFSLGLAPNPINHSFVPKMQHLAAVERETAMLESAVKKVIYSHYNTKAVRTRYEVIRLTRNKAS